MLILMSFTCTNVQGSQLKMQEHKDCLVYELPNSMKHYWAKPLAHLPKSLQDDTKHAVMKPDKLELHKNVHCIQLCNVRLTSYACTPRFYLRC